MINSTSRYAQVGTDSLTITRNGLPDPDPVSQAALHSADGGPDQLRSTHRPAGQCASTTSPRSTSTIRPCSGGSPTSTWCFRPKIFHQGDRATDRDRVAAVRRIHAMSALLDTLGIRILLWLGDPIPLPQPPDLIQSLLSADVTQTDDGDGFQLVFALSQDGLLGFPQLVDPATAIFSQVVIAVVAGANFQVLINGVITHHQIDPHPEPGRSTLTLSGRDVSVMMDLEDRSASYPNMPDFVIVAQILARYPLLGLIPVVTPTTRHPDFLRGSAAGRDRPAVHPPDGEAKRICVSHHPHVARGEPGRVRAELRASLPQSTLAINTITSDNVTSLIFERRSRAGGGHRFERVHRADQQDGDSHSGAAVLRLPPLVVSPTPSKRKDQLRESANETPSRAFLSSIAKVTGAPERVTGTGEVDTSRYGSIMKARGLIGVRGVSAYDGFYYLRQVTHHLEVGKHTQSFVMTRRARRASARWWCREPSLLWKVPRHRHRQQRPVVHRTHPRHGPRRPRFRRERVGDGLYAVRGLGSGLLRAPRRRRGCLDRVRARRSRLSDLDRVLVGLPRRPATGSAGPAVPENDHQIDRRQQHHVGRHPGDRRRHDPDVERPEDLPHRARHSDR